MLVPAWVFVIVPVMVSVAVFPGFSVGIFHIPLLMVPGWCSGGESRGWCVIYVYVGNGVCSLVGYGYGVGGGVAYI